MKNSSKHRAGKKLLVEYTLFTGNQKNDLSLTILKRICLGQSYGTKDFTPQRFAVFFFCIYLSLPQRACISNTPVIVCTFKAGRLHTKNNNLEIILPVIPCTIGVLLYTLWGCCCTTQNPKCPDFSFNPLLHSLQVAGCH